MSAMKSQVASLEFVLMLAGYLAFLAVLASIASANLQGSISAASSARNLHDARAACFALGFFSLDGRRTFAEGRMAALSLRVNQSASANAPEGCFAKTRQGTSLAVETGANEQ